MDDLLTYDAAATYLRNRLTMPTRMKSKGFSWRDEEGRERFTTGLDSIPAGIRNQAFFSARVAEEHILSPLREISDSFSRGEIDLATARAGLKKFLVSDGYLSDDGIDEPPPGVSLKEWREARKLTNLASTARLNLILRTNAAQAQAVGDYQQMMDPEIMAIFPYLIYRGSGLATSRADHAADDGKVFRKDDPYLLSHWPGARDFNCHCYHEECDEETARAMGGAVPPSPKAVFDNPSGYAFDPSAAFTGAPLDGIPEVKSRRAMLDSIRRHVESDKVEFVARPSNGGLLPSPAATGVISRSELDAFVAAQTESIRSRQPAAAPDSIRIGELSPDLRDMLGLSGTSEIRMARGGRRRGVTHMLADHLDALEGGEFAEAVAEALSGRGVGCSLVMKPGKRDFLLLEAPETGALLTLRRSGADGWEIVSAHKLPGANGEEYRRKQSELRPKTR